MRELKRREEEAAAKERERREAEEAEREAAARAAAQAASAEATSTDKPDSGPHTTEDRPGMFDCTFYYDINIHTSYIKITSLLCNMQPQVDVEPL